MKTPIIQRGLWLTAAAGMLAGVAHGQILQDEFSGSTIDLSLWQTSTPFFDSSITASDGFAVFQNRGRLLSVTNFPGAIDIRGRFAFTGNPHDSFYIVTRCDGIATQAPGYFDHGIGFRFIIQDDSGGTNGNLAIERFAVPNPSPLLAIGDFPISTNIFYNFRITDDGTNVAFYVGDLLKPRIEAVDTNRFGHQVGFFNREGSGGGNPLNAGSVVRLDYLVVTPVVPAPRLTIRVHQIELCWDAVPASIYQVQFKSALTTNNWVDFGSPLRAEGTALCILDSVPRGEPQRFYRLLDGVRPH